MRLKLYTKSVFVENLQESSVDLESAKSIPLSSLQARDERFGTFRDYFNLR